MHLTEIGEGIAYLGFMISRRGARIHPLKFKDKVRKLTPRNSGLNGAPDKGAVDA